MNKILRISVRAGNTKITKKADHTHTEKEKDQGFVTFKSRILLI